MLSHIYPQYYSIKYTYEQPVHECFFDNLSLPYT